jgi:large subunit ribosomal protein L15
MMIHEITALAGQYKKRRRVGRGEASGYGKTSGRGHKGARSRSGYSLKKAFEGGQMPYFRRISKRGFTNVQFKTEFWIANLCDIVAHKDFARGGEVTAERLAKAGLIRDASRPLKVLGDLGEAKELKVKLAITAARVSDKVRTLVTGAGGSVTETGTRRDNVRGVDRNSEDRTPKNLNKKPKRRAAKKFDAAKITSDEE